MMPITRDSVQHNDRIMPVDNNGTLEMFSYGNCTNSDSDFVKSCRGLVFHGDRLVSRTSYVDEYVSDSPQLVHAIQNVSDWTFSPAYEGTLLRVFNFRSGDNVNGTWMITTHRKLDAFRSKWSSPDSFGLIFSKALEREDARNPAFREKLGFGSTVLTSFLNSLNPTHQYHFLVRNTAQNRIVSEPPNETSPAVYHVYTCDSAFEPISEDVGLPIPERMQFDTFDKLIDHVNTMNPAKHQGVFGTHSSGKQIKILNPTYQSLFELRGNEQSVPFRYLQIRNVKEQNDRFRQLYPANVPTFNMYELFLEKIANYIHTSYLQRFQEKKFVVVPQEEYRVVVVCHSWHIQTRKFVTLEKVREILSQQSPVALNTMIRRHLQKDSE